MESNYRNRDFEQYLKENADQYRMFPSEKVWKGINSTLHTRRKWYGFGLAFLLLLTGTAVTWVMISYPVAKNQPVTTINPKPAEQAAPSAPKEISSEVTNKVMPFRNAPDPASSRQLFSPVAEPADIADLPVQENAAELVTILPDERILHRYTQGSANQKASPGPVGYDELDEAGIVFSDNGEISRPAISAVSHRPARGLVYYPLGIESVPNTYLPKKQEKRISWLFYVTPTISYRQLTENKSSDNASSPSYVFASMNSDVNKAVTHKPDMGLQVGLAARYPITQKLKIRGGLQFNINRYDIKAYASNSEVATINVNDPNGITPVTTWTNLRTVSGYKSNWLKNYYFSISAPIGIELRLLGNDKTSIGIAGTVQPTYIIKDRAYLLSTDHKNYAKVPSLVRHVNVNTAFETFVNYVSGKTKWQIGPQVRYQVLSSFHNKYQVKENLFDFGVKIGVTLNE